MQLCRYFTTWNLGFFRSSPCSFHSCNSTRHLLNQGFCNRSHASIRQIVVLEVQVQNNCKEQGRSQNHSQRQSGSLPRLVDKPLAKMMASSGPKHTCLKAAANESAALPCPALPCPAPPEVELGDMIWHLGGSGGS